jgi:hypothetical protein
MPPVRIVPALDEVEDRHARFDLGAEAHSLQKFTLEGGEEGLGERVVYASPNDPIDGRTPISRQRFPKA